MDKILKFVCLLFVPFQLFSGISALYLSWYDDPTTTMTVQWHTDLNTPETQLFYKKNDQTEWQQATASYARLPSTQIDVHHVNLSQLAPNSEYEFRIGSDPTVYRFRTMPQYIIQPLSFVVGGDLFSSRKLFRKMAQTICERDPDFIVIGGNIANAIHPGFFQLPSRRLRHWLAFFSEWKKSFARNDHRIIPFLVIPGEEDIRSDDYDLFFSLFAFPQKKLYRNIQFGNYLTLYLLDSGHFHPIDGPQSYWLSHALKETPTTAFSFAIYHESAYPSSTPYFGSAAKKIRTDWCSLFDEYHLQAAFEHHNHAFKRTFPLFHNQINAQGTVYLGDGSWGAEPRKTNDLWYLEKKAKKNGVWLVQLASQKATLTAIDLFNQPIDELSISSH